jgi:hypothetical protein
MQATRGKMDAPLLNLGAFIRDPYLWVTTTGSAIVGLVTPDHIPIAAWLPIAALVGSFLGKLAQVFIQWLRERRETKADLINRFETLLRDEREAHDKTEERYLKRIQFLEDKLFERDSKA